MKIYNFNLWRNYKFELIANKKNILQSGELNPFFYYRVFKFFGSVSISIRYEEKSSQKSSCRCAY